jgi:beta-glucanase (GH16 family)
VRPVSHRDPGGAHSSSTSVPRRPRTASRITDGSVAARGTLSERLVGAKSRMAVAAFWLVLSIMTAAAVVAFALDSAAPLPAAAQVRITAAPTTVYDADGLAWQGGMGSDRNVHWAGRRVACSAAVVYGTSSPGLYRCSLVGVRTLSIPVRRGTYGVTLFFAETFGAGSGDRVFDVSAEGTPVSQPIDIAKAVGPNQAYHAAFTVAVADGSLDIGFGSLRGEPIVSAVELTRVQRSVGPTRVVWSDDFTGAAGSPIDGSRWGHDVGAGGWGNDELQRYTRDRSNSQLDGLGHLAIVARKSSSHGSARYTSARITTRGRFSFRYGEVEARIRVPAGQGLLPAFWALGGDLEQRGWPRSGEIDFMEVVGSNPWVTHGSVHGPTASGQDYQEGDGAQSTTRLDQGFHTYGALWFPGTIQLSLNGTPYATVVRADLDSSDRWVFNRPFFLLLNLAVGGNWPGPPTVSTRFPATMLVDWVRVLR